jgi:hypothetical protein
VIACGGILAACERQDVGCEVQETPPGTIPVPGAGGPGEAPNPHPAGAGPDAPYSGTVEPVRRGADTFAALGGENLPDAGRTGTP